MSDAVLEDGPPVAPTAWSRVSRTVSGWMGRGGAPAGATVDGGEGSSAQMADAASELRPASTRKKPRAGVHMPARDQAEAGDLLRRRWPKSDDGEDDDLDLPPMGTVAVSPASARHEPAMGEVTYSPGRFIRGDERFLEGVRAAQVEEGSPRVLWALYLLFVIVISAGVWAAYAKVDVVSKAEAKVVPEEREQVVASLEAGILRNLFVREGAIVEVGQDLAQLDPTRVAAQQNEGHARQTALKATSARLMAEVTGGELKFPADVLAEEDIVKAETDAFRARRQALNESMDGLRRNMTLLDVELNTARQLSEQGLMSEVEVMRLRRQRNDLVMQVQERRNRFRQEASTELLKVRTELAQLGEQQVVKDDAMKRTVLQSPVRGIVKNIRANTIGGVVSAGSPVMEIVPLGERVLIEAHIKPADIGFVRIGQTADIKLSSYDYYTYGGLKGTIEYISPDALQEDGRAPGAENTYYRARLRTDVSTLQAKDGKPLAVLPGMNATVEIRTGDRTVAQFLLKPMLKGTEAMRER